MTDYSSWKVADLKAELKRRGIPQTGLRVKQNFIDRLLEADGKQEGGAPNGESANTQDASENIEQATPEQPAQEPDTVVSQPEEPEAQVTAPESEEPKDNGKAKRSPKEEQQEQQPDVQTEQRKPEPPAEGSMTDAKAAEQAAESLQQTQPEVSSKESEAIQVAEAGIGSEGSAPSRAPSQPEAEHPVEPVEQAPGSAEAVHGQDSKELPDSVGKAATQVSAETTGLSTPLPVEEMIEDTRKRKRRSQTPIPTPEAVASKRAKAQEESPRVLLPEDRDIMDVEGSPGKKAVAVPAENEQAQNQNGDDRNDAIRRVSISDDVRTRGTASIKQDARFKDLFAPADREQIRPRSPPADTNMEDAEVEPALHVATEALYIDGLMRPLQPAALKNHLVSIATAPGASPDPDVIVDFYLDPIKTHCFVKFANISAASRARTALHGVVWPNESNRKALFVDFIPQQKLQQWVAREEESRGRGGPPPRWEVRYDRTDDGVEAVLQEVDLKSTASRQAPGRASTDFSRPPPLGPRASMGVKDRRPSGPPPLEPRPRPGQGFKALDDLFESTTTKPKLYYLRVPREVADRRLDRFDDLLRKGSFPRRGGDENRRITFEDGDFFVDNGPEYGRGYGRRRGRGRGGGMGDSWRDDRRGRD
ncbi:hypothetical protein KXW75_000852 [Aspergillus fumigatus]|nr:hypothetical protein KXX01_008404 [Aspergillus fumigatus]KAH2019782.1 hypothetical protein KXV45_003713 [Aspergillus fumigatus]KAH2123701.1 hypothetical protein KXW75_000852 [Aspergillus fumigatus]KAH2363897.1 hypothetical protein KXV98_003284 [Aspergillus fumigatus]KAH2473172.1 hypothetical protein KXV71_008223 [Aspergillus fumigatus]